MPITQVGTTPVTLVTHTPAARPVKRTVIVSNEHATNIAYVERANSSVSAADHGFRIQPGMGVRIDLEPGEKLWAIASAASTPVAVL